MLDTDGMDQFFQFLAFLGVTLNEKLAFNPPSARENLWVKTLL